MSDWGAAMKDQNSYMTTAHSQRFFAEILEQAETSAALCQAEKETRQMPPCCLSPQQQTHSRKHAWD